MISRQCCTAEFVFNLTLEYFGSDLAQSRCNGMGNIVGIAWGPLKISSSLNITVIGGVPHAPSCAPETHVSEYVNQVQHVRAALINYTKL